VTTSDPVGQLIREIAAKHGVAVGRDDPILVLQTINAQLLEDGAKAQRDMLKTHKEELEAIANSLASIWRSTPFLRRLDTRQHAPPSSQRKLWSTMEAKIGATRPVASPAYSRRSSLLPPFGPASPTSSRIDLYSLDAGRASTPQRELLPGLS
jgi:hypothetical protein